MKLETRNSLRFSIFELRISAMIFALTGLLVGCRHQTPAAAVDFFPASNSVPGWVKTSETRSFDAGNLWKYIDGDADKYVQAGVVKTFTSDYCFNGKTDATVDVFVMGNTEGAKKIFDSESADGRQPLTISDAARYAKGSLTFRQGTYFVRLVAYEETPEIAAALTSLARALSSRFGKSRG